MASEKDEKAKKKSKKKPKLDFEALSKLSVYDFGVPPHFPKLELPPSKLMERPLVTREEWGAEPPTAVVPLKLPANWILFTYTDTEECDTKEHCLQIVKRLQTQHMRERGLPDIQYNFLAGSDFNVYEGRGWTARPDKNEKYPKLIKKNAVEIAYIGNFKDKTPSMEMQRHAWNLVEDSLDQDKLDVDTRIIDDFHDSADIDVDQILKMNDDEAEACPDLK